MFTDWPPGPLDRNTSISRSFGSIVDVDRLRLGQHRDGRRARVHPTLALGDRHALHPVRPRLVLEARPGVVALHHERDLPEPAHVGRLAVEHLELPAVGVGVALVHVEQVGGPEVALLAALPTADLDDDVLALVGIAGHEQLAEPRRRARRAALPWSAISRRRGSRASRRRPRPRASFARRLRSVSVARYALYASTIGLSSACRRPASRAADWSPEA